MLSTRVASTITSSAKKCEPLVGLCIQKSEYSTGSDDKEYLHRSIVPTYHFQKSLPRLPVPKLEKTCERYLNSQKPVLSQDEFIKTEAVTKLFLETDGAELNKELIEIDKQNKHTSYITGPWFDMYLSDRRSLMLNQNPFLVLTSDPKPEYNNQLIRSTNMIVSSLRFMKTLRAEILEPEVFHLNASKSDNQSFRKFVKFLPEMLSWYGAYWYKAFPLDMSQYGNLFNSTRIPLLGKDELFTDKSARHLLVMRNGNFYVFDCIDSDGNIRPPEEIMANIDFILKDKQPKPEHPLAVLTSENRDTWANIRKQLIDDGNGEKLRLIDSALFALVLDDFVPKSYDDISRNFLHGDASNRFFDKSFMLMFQKDGECSINFEHSWGDGVAILRYMNEIFDDSTKKPVVHPNTNPAAIDSNKEVTMLDFNLSPKVKDAISEAKSKFQATVDSLDVSHLEYPKITKGFVKEQKLSPDSLMQLVIQLGNYKQTGKTAATYESCSTAAFKHGRTETMRPATMATKRVCEMLYDSKTPPSSDDLRKALSECSNLHNELTKQAAMGQGFDRHLFALKNLAAKKGNLPLFFQDPAYANLNHIILSTSTLSSHAAVYGGFGPVVPNGYGIGYGIRDTVTGFNITAYKGKKDVHNFISCLEDSLNILHKILSGSK